KGKVYLAKEGISGSIFGDDELTRKYKNYLKGYKIFEDIWFKETPTDSVAFSKMHVRVKEEIVNSGLRSTKLEHTAPKLTPEQLLKFYEDKKDFVIVDARNWYESKIGKFKNAITPQITHFREWPKVVESLSEYKDKTIVTYCTGGIRCEKASAYMREQGFKDVYQIDGGILNYILQFPDTYWEGGMFVFDDRRVFEPNTNAELMFTANCHFCGKPTSYHINCHNIDCDKIIVSCHDCKVEKEYCCSDECRTSKNKRKVYHG
ncbi:MAG: rhodanese-related sulfurtransferase, partial [Ignavibacterium sp.]|nr:rhodanese-related sulfurtransferase [Ignavibacterium sp.]